MLSRLLDTDQIDCYDPHGRRLPCEGSGQDAAYSKTRLALADDRFQVMGAVVRDGFSGAIWSKDANPAEFPLSWEEAWRFVAAMRAKQAHGYNGWQLPSRDLLFSLISHQHINPALIANHPFENVFTGYYWNGDTCRRLPDQAWYVHLGGGRVHRGMKHGSYMVWPVSLESDTTAQPPEPPEQYFSLRDSTVHDARTGLIWSRDADPAGNHHTWQEALTLVHTLNERKWGGFADWRLPNIRELESLIDLRAHSPALTTRHPFRHVREAYWSSTTSVYEPRYAWTLYSRDGMVGVGFKPRDGFHTWPVRNG